jgi:Flp pilus assembly protein TadG
MHIGLLGPPAPASVQRPQRGARRYRRQDERGYFTIVAIIMFVTIFGVAAFAVDVGNWYLTAQQAQRAADAAALAGVPSLPADEDGAFATAQTFSTANGFENGVDTVEVDPELDSSSNSSTRLRVTVSKTVDNVFGGLFGIPTTTITRTAVADYASPVSMGSPCNTFGNDPEPSTFRGSTCGLVNGQLWAAVASPSSSKESGDAYQSAECTFEDGCLSDVNTDYQPDGYFYSLSLSEPVDNLVIQAFDPAFVSVGPWCADDGIFEEDSGVATDARNDFVTDEATRYVAGDSDYCTGDGVLSFETTAMNTQFTVRDPGEEPWDPSSYPPHADCQRTYLGYFGPLFPALDQDSETYRSDIAESFRRWDTLCTISHAEAGTYLIQVKSNGLGADSSNADNEFSLRAFSSSNTQAQESIAIAARERMRIFSNKPSATMEFYLARVPSGSTGQTLEVKLFDVGDSSTSGTIQVVAPPDSGVSFADCIASGPVSGTLPDCSLTVTRSTHNGKKQYLEVPIPEGYSCDDRDGTACWVRLRYYYGTGSIPSDATSWEASMEGDPVRLVE